MVRGITAALALGLLVLWMAGINSPVSQPWIAWADMVVGALAFFFAANINEASPKSRLVGGPVLISAVLFLCWLGGVASATGTSWLAWWNFAFACAYLLVGILASAARPAVVRHPGHGTGHREAA